MGIRSNHFLNNFFNNFSVISYYDSTRISIIVYIVLAVIVLDTTLNQNPELRLHLKDSGLDVAFFVFCGIIAIVGQFYIIQYVRQKSSQIRKKVVYLGISYKIVSIIQYLVIAIFVFVLLGVTAIGQYHTTNLII